MSIFRKIVQEKKIVTNPKYVRLARSIRNLTGEDVSRPLGLRILYRLDGPRDDVLTGIFPLKVAQQTPLQELSNPLKDLGEKEFWGHFQNFWKLFGTQKSWLLIGPFDNTANRGLQTAFAPEKEFNLSKFYRGKERPVHWQVYADWTPRGSVDLTQIFRPKDNVCAYALTAVRSPKRQKVQLRLGTNDSCVLWLDGKRVFVNPQPGRAILDKNIVPATLQKGENKILLKICQGGAGWGFYFRVTDTRGRALSDLVFHVPEEEK